jgi:FtsP/CotA-like multicopper oxidase with cupredoxin domain
LSAPRIVGRETVKWEASLIYERREQGSAINQSQIKVCGGQNPNLDGTGTTRRSFFKNVLAFCAWPVANLWHRAIAQPASTPTQLTKIKEIPSQGGKLKLTLTVRSKEWMVEDKIAGVPLDKQGLRYFEGKDASGSVIWPPIDADRPFPGPTFRAKVGDRVEITYLNHIDTRDFARTGIDRGGCDIARRAPPPEITYPGKTGDAAPNCFHGSSTINLHFHGTHVTPDGLGDNVLLQLRPEPAVTQQSVKLDFQAIFDNGPPTKYLDLPEAWRKEQEALVQKYDKDNGLPPAIQLWPPNKKNIDEGRWPQFQIGAYPYCFDLTKYAEDEQGRPAGFRMGQCPGTHWYHAHKHGSTAINVMNGLVGAFVIEGDYDEALAKALPNLRETEKVLVVHNRGDRPNIAAGNIALGALFASPTMYINGEVNPTITMRPGEIQLWRMVNATIKAVTTFGNFVPLDGGPTVECRQTAQDGVQFSPKNFVDQPILKFMVGNGPRPASFSPGNRIDILVKAPRDAGGKRYKLELMDTNNSIPQTILTLSVEGEPVSPEMNFPSEDKFPKLPSFLSDIQAADTVPSSTNPAQPRMPLLFSFVKDDNTNTPGPTNSGAAPQLFINDKKFDGENYDQEMVLNAVEEWTLENSSGVAHPFHIHVNPFQVVEIFDPMTGRSYQPSSDYIWQDVITIPAANGAIKGRVKIRHRFVDFVGSYVLHCHMLAHEDRGMMQLVRVVPAVTDLGHAGTVPHH